MHLSPTTILAAITSIMAIGAFAYPDNPVDTNADITLEGSHSHEIDSREAMEANLGSTQGLYVREAPNSGRRLARQRRVICRVCGNSGHTARDCPQRRH